MSSHRAAKKYYLAMTIRWRNDFAGLKPNDIISNQSFKENPPQNQAYCCKEELEFSVLFGLQDDLCVFLLS